MLAAALTLLPALLAIFGKVLFWPSHPAAGQPTTGAWGRAAARVIRRPVLVLVGGLLLFIVLAAGITGFTAGGFTSPVPSGTDSAAGDTALASHFPSGSRNPETLLLQYDTSIWSHPQSLGQVQQLLSSSPEVRSFAGPLDPNGTTLALEQLVSLHSQLGAPQSLPPSPANNSVPLALYEAYHDTAQFISFDGRTVEFAAVLSAGPAGSQAAINAIPSLRTTLNTAAVASGAQQNGVVGLDAIAYDINHYSTSDLASVAPVVIAALALLLAAVLRSLVAPIYLVATVTLSYLAALGLASFVFIHVAGDSVNFVIPILLFIFAMALGEDYNILLMTRVREEAHGHDLREALVRAVGHTGGTITSAGLVLAGTFTVLALAGNSTQSRQLGFTIAFAVLMDTFFVRTLLVPSIAVLLGRWNWWPSSLSRAAAVPIPLVE